jgi:hypothetical protein
MTTTRTLASAAAFASALALAGLQAQAAGYFAGGSAGYQWTMTGPVGWSGVPGLKNRPNTRSAIKAQLVRDIDSIPAGTEAELFASADMAPDGMPEMTARVRRLPEVDPTIYRLAIDPIMAGRWALHLSAQPSGLSGPVQGTLTVALPKEGPQFAGGNWLLARNRL